MHLLAEGGFVYVLQGRWGRMSECQLFAIGRDKANHSLWIERYALFGLCGMAREPYHHAHIVYPATVCSNTVSSLLGSSH